MTDYLDKIICGDCLEVMASMPESSVDSIVTDPPYGLSFIRKDWDHGVPGEAFWREALRVAKPGAHLLAFGGTRTHHRLMCAIEDAGWEIRDCLGWLYGSGFPKSLDVSKAIDKMAGAEREVVGHKTAGMGSWRCWGKTATKRGNTFGMLQSEGDNANADKVVPITAPATPEAVRWNGWGTALKPAWEPIVLARKPLRGTIAQNVLQYGTGALNIDGCRVETDDTRGKASRTALGVMNDDNWKARPIMAGSECGRFPANLIHDGSDEVEAVFPVTRPARASVGGVKDPHPASWGKRRNDGNRIMGHNDNGGSASRFFYCAKASSSDRGEGNNHPTVKPLSLMRYLCRLVTPPGGVVLDPFAGSGSTLLAALKEGFRFIGIEKEEKYCEIARRRVAEATPSLFAPER